MVVAFTIAAPAFGQTVVDSGGRWTIPLAPRSSGFDVNWGSVLDRDRLSRAVVVNSVRAIRAFNRGEAGAAEAAFKSQLLTRA
jgi:hypothetical protein